MTIKKEKLHGILKKPLSCPNNGVHLTFLLRDYNGQVREIIVTGHGRELPILTITNDFHLKAKKIISTYAHRWFIENNIAENVNFFNLNALASPVVHKIDFDVAMTLIANTLYKILSSKFKLF